jgi:hypothetical protein
MFDIGFCDVGFSRIMDLGVPYQVRAAINMEILAFNKISGQKTLSGSPGL